MSSAENAPHRPPIRVGLLVDERAGSRQRERVLAAGRRLQSELLHWFPRYAWHVEPARCRGIVEPRRSESSELLRLAAEAREHAHQDFVVLVTGNELVARYRAFALAALSRPLDAAVLSTARLVPEDALDDGPDDDLAGGSDIGSDDGVGNFECAGKDEGRGRGESSGNVRDDASNDRLGSRPATNVVPDHAVVDRLATLMMHALAHLAGERPTRHRDRLLHRPDAPTDLDGMTRFDERELAALDAAFESVADTRLEEREASTRTGLRFALRAAAINRGEIVEAVRAARPWEFPQRLSRLTTAAVSTLAILLMTAESWDLGLSQSWPTVLALALAVLVLTSGFVIHRQQLLLARHRHLSEQLVASRLSAVLIVVAGLATTWLAIFVLALAAALALFDAPLIVGWAASHGLEEANVDTLLKARMATFCASIGLLIGSLGASFEDQHHFRHVIFVDEEL